MIDVILETLIDALKMTPILFLAYLFMEFLELKAYVLGVEDEVWCGMRVECRSNLQKELQLLLFEM